MTIGIGIVGAGIMGADHARILHQGIAGATLAGLHDADKPRAERLAAETGGPRIFETADAMIADPGIGAVLIAAPDANLMWSQFGRRELHSLWPFFSGAAIHQAVLDRKTRVSQL